MNSTTSMTTILINHTGCSQYHNKDEGKQNLKFEEEMKKLVEIRKKAVQNIGLAQARQKKKL